VARGTGSTSALLAAVGAAALWGTTGTAQALGPDGTDPVSVGALRIALGAVVLLLLTATPPGRAGTGAAAASGRLPVGVVLLLGGVCVAAYQACFFVGVARAGVAVGTVVALGVAPMATGLLGLLLDERPDRRWGISTAVAVAGVVLLVLGAGSGGTSLDLAGVAAAVGAGASYAGYTVAGRTLLLRGASGVRVMAGFFTLGAVLLLPALLLTDLGWLGTAEGLVMVGWLGVVATGLSYVLFQHGLARLSARTVGTLSLAEPVTATLLGVLLLGEQLTTPAAVGVAVVVAGLLVTALPRRPRDPVRAAGADTARADLP
jgi:drug/metabolite transporter, DME family